MTTAAQAQAWRKADGSPAGVGEMSDCRLDARRQAELRYPPTPPAGVPQGSSLGDESGPRFQLELSLFNQCMRRKGFEQAPRN